METLIHADIFFFISTIALVVISTGIAIALFYIIRIVRNVSHVSEKVREESDEVLEDLKELRGNMKRDGLRLSHLGGFFASLFRRGSRTARKHE